MITIAEPKEHIDKLWGKQKIREGETYRLMRYVLRVDHEDKVLLHNVVTGRLVVLEREEAEALETLPAAYTPAMEQLVTEHYLVPENYDEHQQAVNLRNILHKFDIAAVSNPISITRYTILPTTACNARCYYCYEHGIPAFTMTEQIADDTIKFIADHCGEKKNQIMEAVGTLFGNVKPQVDFEIGFSGQNSSFSLRIFSHCSSESLAPVVTMISSAMRDARRSVFSGVN